MNERNIPAPATCAAHHHSTPVPLFVYYIQPIDEGGLDTANNRILLCATACADVLLYFAEILRVGDSSRVPWPIMLRFNWRVRRIASEAWARMHGSPSISLIYEPSLLPEAPDS